MADDHHKQVADTIRELADEIERDQPECTVRIEIWRPSHKRMEYTADMARKSTDAPT